MEELQDAIEDAQYVSAINCVDHGPRPVIAWEVPTEEALSEWKNALRAEWESSSKKDSLSEPLGFQWTLSSSLGFFLFSSYLKDSCNDYLQINFVEDILRWKRLRGRQRGELAKKIVEKYLMPSPIDTKTQEPKLPEKTEIEEYDLDLSSHHCSLSTDDLKDLLDKNLDSTCSKCCIGLDGPVRDEIIATMKTFEFSEGNRSKETSGDITSNNLNEISSTNEQELESGVEKFESLGRMKHRHSILSSSLPDDFFLRAEHIVVECIRKKHWEKFSNTECSQWCRLLDFLWYQDRRVVEEDFFVMRVLGRGGFGLVTACKKGTSGKLYAMKVMNKKRIMLKKSEQLALNERSSLAAVNSPFVVNLKYSFQSKENIFLILDLMTGGDLGFHLNQKGRFPKRECLYYAARIMLGLQALHDQNYVYRDLKPENCLLSEDGRVKITDLGLATQVTPTLHGAAGTRGYWAPEMLR